MAYCEYTDVQLEAGTSLGTITTSDITSLISRSDEEIVDMLLEKGLTAPASASQLKTASICLTIAKIKRRQAHELTRPNSLSLGGDISFSINSEAEAAAYESKGRRAVSQYVEYAGGSGVVIVRNHNMIRGY
ncbi:MAG: hypothetical protein LUQ50_12205 [Methanospirillum sp.]|uniref:hypothetical protein n=1 Tax=Methanospirillum sp. TaxID=45200 RepID=UPI00236BABDF|nr:hypothetical protein [Methanospirillum sp.]MDD1729819.1 hypothetical protein [Methanospirillum sp.]